MSNTQSVLDQMTAGVMEKKANKATKLTPVGEEAKQTLPRTPAPFPNDMPQEVLVGIIRDLTTQITRLTEVRDSLNLIAGKEAVAYVEPPTVVSATIAVDKAAEAAADETQKFKEDFARMQREAQAAVYSQLDDAPVVPLPQPKPVPASWECPEHGATALNTLTSRKGRIYKACTQCEEFER